MEMPRRRTGSYDPRTAVGNILAPISGNQGSAELRTTPSTRATAAAGTSRPPWATELDTADAAVSQATPCQNPPQGRPFSTSRPQRTGVQTSRDTDGGFSFHTAAPAVATVRASSPQAAASNPIHQDASGSATSWDNLSGPWPNSAPPQGRGPPGARAGPGPVDQLDLWSRQQQQQPPQGHQTPAQGRRSDVLYARVDHVETGDTAAAPPPPGTAMRRVAAPEAPRRGSVTGDGPRLPPGDLSYGDAVGSRGAVATGRSGGAAAARVSASPARAAPPPADGRVAVRSTSTPKPRPAVPPKRSTSITDNVRRDWVDVGAPDRKPGGAAGRARGSGGGGSGSGGRWDADPDGDDRGSWLFAGDAAEQRRQPASPSSKSFREGDSGSSHGPGPGPGPGSASEKRRPAERPNSARRPADSDHDSDGVGGGDGRASQGRHDGRPQQPRRPQSPAASGLEATLSLAAGAAGGPPAVLGGSSSGAAGMSLGHGPSVCLGSSGSTTAGRSGGRPGGAVSQAESASQVQALREENERLKDQVQHLERLLATGTPAPAEAGRSRKAPLVTARPSSANVTDPGAGMAAAAASSVVLQQYKSQVIQLQRQVALMSQEIEAKSRLGFEAEGVLLEIASKLAEVAASSGGDATSAAPGAAAEAAAAAAASCLGGGGGCEALSRERLMQLHKWSKQMLGRLRSEKSATSKLFTQEAHDSRGSRGGFGFGAASWAAQGGGSGTADGGSYAPKWVVPFLPAGGNRFLMAGGGGGAAGGEAAAAADDLAGAAGGGGGACSSTNMAAIAAGQAVLLADPLLAHRLELQLAAVAPKLAALAVLLKTQLLPAMPWLGLESSDRLQSEVGETAESVAQCVEALVALCALLPAGAAVFGDGPLAQEPKRRAAEMDAGRDSWLYSSPELLDAAVEPTSPAVSDDGVISVPRLQAAIAPLLRDRKTGSKALADILEPVRTRSQSAVAKRAVLEAELRFAARASALHAEHVSHLMLSVGMALEECRGAKDAAAIKAYFNAAAAVRQVLEAADGLEVHPCETCLKALVDVIRVHREALGRLPELLLNAPAADVEGRLLRKVEELHAGFKKAIIRLEAHKRRHLDGVPGGGGAAAGGGGAGGGELDADYDDEDFEVAEETRGGGGSELAAGAGTLPPTARRPTLPSTTSSPGQQQQQVPAAKPGKPPKARPEWQE